MTKGRSLIVCTALAVLAAAFAATGATGAPRLAAAPANDNFADAAAVSGRYGYVEATNVDATKEAGEPNHAGQAGGASVWFMWTAANRGRATLDTCYSGLDTVLAVYTGDELATLHEVAADDNGCEGGSRVSFVTTAGQSYRVVVDGAGGATGVFWLSWLLGPPNDDFADAVMISGDSGVVDGDNIAARTEAGEPEHGGPGGRSVWYSWVAPSSGPATFELCGSDFDTLLAVYTGSDVAGLTQIAANDEDCGSQSRVSFQANAGTTYRIAVDGFYGDWGNIVLGWNRFAVPPRNDRPPVILGNAVDGALLSAANGEWGGTPPFSYGYQWLRCNLFGTSCQSVPGATSAAYRLSSGDVGSRLRVAVTATNAAGASTETSPATSIVAPVAPTNVTAPAISGTPYVGADLDSNEGEWSGTQPFSWSVQWQRCDAAGATASCVDISGEVSSLYTVTVDDLNHALRVRVTVSNGAGSATAVSALTRPVTRRQVRRADCVVPRVRGKQLKAAKRSLRSAHCSVGRIRRARSSQARGRVISQSPRPGARRPSGSRVNLVVSRGRR
jgi:PASTA domain